jgi:type II secretory pathway pseudopilin PulG
MVEVMAVIAVTSTLGVMLVSSIKSSKDLALQVSCMSNVSQIRTVAEMHRKDFGKLPYSDTWLTDFSFASSYLGEDNSLSIFNCPVAEDKPVTSYSQLSNSTSYYYVPDAKQLIQNIEDGQKVGLLSSEIEQLSQIQDGAIYDKSPSHHNGKVNTTKTKLILMVPLQVRLEIPKTIITFQV